MSIERDLITYPSSQSLEWFWSSPCGPCYPWSRRRWRRWD